MCEFISWIEKNGNVYYLTYHDIYRTRRGKELRDYCKSKEDLIGHNAIRFYYAEFMGGEDKECTDFSSPNNFPKEIVADIKAGKFRGLGTEKGLLQQQAWAEYSKIEQQALAEYLKIEQPALAEYLKIEQQALAEYLKIEQPALAEYLKIEQQAFWDLFRIVKNRNPLWR